MKKKWTVLIIIVVALLGVVAGYYGYIELPAREFRGYFGFDPRHPVADGERRVSQETRARWIIYYRVGRDERKTEDRPLSSWEYMWTERHDLYMIALCAERSALRWRYHPVTRFQITHEEWQEVTHRQGYESDYDHCVTPDFHWKTWDKTCGPDPAK